MKYIHPMSSTQTHSGVSCSGSWWSVCRQGKLRPAQCPGRDTQPDPADTVVLEKMMVAIIIKIAITMVCIVHGLTVFTWKVILPLMVQFSAQTTCPSERTVWFGGKLRLIEKVALAPVRVGASFFRSKVTSPPEKKITHNLTYLDQLEETFLFLEIEYWASPVQQFLNLGSPSFHTGYIREFHER